MMDFPDVVRTFEGASDKMLAAVLDQSADCIKVIGPTGTLDFMNRNGRCAMQIDDFAAVAGKLWWELWPRESQSLIRAAVMKAECGESSSFEAFCPTAKGEPRWWDVSVSPLRDELGRIQGLISVSRDITERRKALELRETMVAEMRHRLQNAYALTSAIIRAMAKGSSNREAFASEITAKLHHLGIAQSLLLDDLVRRLTEPFSHPNCPIIIEPLPEVRLDERQARTIALVFGELSTNSTKYGALGHPGSIAVRGSLEGGTLCLVWNEISNGEVRSHGREGGSGLGLIRRTLAAQGGSFDLRWRSDGLEAEIRMVGF